MGDHNPSQLLAVLRQYDYLADLKAAEEAALGEAISQTTVNAGAWLFEQGEPGDAMYLLYKGVMQVVLKNHSGETVILDVIDPGTIVGEMALLTGQPRSAGLRAISDSALIRLPNDRIEALAAVYPAMYERLLDIAEERFQNSQMGGVLGRYFGDLDAVALHDLRRRMTWRHVRAGEIVFNQGDRGDYMVFVINGRLRIIAEEVDGAQRLVGEVMRGQNVGEFALLTGKTRTATVVAVRDSDLLLLSAEAFERLSERYPRAVLHVARSIAQRDAQQGRETEPEDAALSIAVLPVSDSAPLAPFMNALERGLGERGRVLRLDAQSLSDRFDGPGETGAKAGRALNTAITAWLYQQESDHDFLLFEADDAWTEWTDRAVRSADRLILLADATAPPELSICEEALFGRPLRPHLDLVLVQPDLIERPSGTARWLDRRAIDAHHHLRLGSDGDWARLLRRLTGRAVGLVLGGGAARGYAHIGVERALHEREVPIDILGGSSMGALMSAAIAMDWPHEELLQRMGQYGSKEALLDLTYPASALYESRKITRALRDNFGDVRIEDLWRPYFCVSTNMTRSEPHIHDRGLLWEAVRASLAIPGVFSPMASNGDILVDGGVMNNLPIDLMRARVGSGTVIAVNVNPRHEKAREWDFEPSINGWQVLRSRVNPLAKAPRVPSLSGTILRAFIINSNYRLEQTRHLADLLVQLDTSQFNIMDWSAYQALIDLGYEQGLRQLDAWL
jgi:predicted acylesterase/phospholipase RssA/CRP-like cAMP-binding protein